MDLLNMLVLAVVQGVTEFLPISSSAHLILVPVLFGWPDQGLAIDIAVHVGTLAAVLVYFHRDVLDLVAGLWMAIRGRPDDRSRLVLHLAVATLPIVVVGLLAKDLAGTTFRSELLIAVTTILFGIVLWIADRGAHRHDRGLGEMTLKDAVVIGTAQVLAILPGTSRSGITMTAALFLRFSRTESARFSMLLSIPTIAAAGLLATLDLVKSGDATLQADAIWAALLAFVAALLTIWGLMKWLRTSSFTPFVIYRLVLGAVLLMWLL